MENSVGFYNRGFSILNTKIQDLWNIKFIKGYATIPSSLVKECSMNDPIGKSFDLIPNWTKQEKCIKIIENQLKK